MSQKKYITDLKQAGADIVGVHLEATPHIHRVLSQIKASGLKAEVVLNPGTPVMAAAEILPLVDQVLIMTVDPGFGGQAFIPETVAKVAEVAAYKKNMDLTLRSKSMVGSMLKRSKKLLAREQQLQLLVHMFLTQKIQQCRSQR